MATLFGAMDWTQAFTIGAGIVAFYAIQTEMHLAIHSPEVV
jgi:hypothetical protein